MNFKFKTTALAVISMGVLAGVVFASAQTASCYQFNTNLRVGNTGADVKALQQTLNAQGFAVAAAGQAGSAGHETSYFGNATKGALIKWQNANASSVLTPWGLTSGTGFFGATSRAEMNKCAGTPSTPTTPGTGTVSGAVSVSLASVQPNNVLVQKSSHAKLADFVFSGTGIVTGVKLQRIGVSNNNAISNIYLYDGSMRVGNSSYVQNNGTIDFTLGTGLFSVTGSKTISVYADIAATTSGQSVGVALTGFTLSGSTEASVSGLNGPTLPIGSANIAGVKFNSGSDASSINVNSGSQNVTIWSNSVQVSDHDVYFNGANFRVIGSAEANSIANARLFIDGAQVGNAVSINSNGDLSFSGSSLLRVGSHNIDVRADIVGGAGRNFYVTLNEGTDMLFQDAQLAGVYASPIYNNASVNNLRGKTIMIESCSSNCTILTADSNFGSQNVVNGNSNEIIGKWQLKVVGENARLLGTATVTVTGATTTDYLSNVRLSVNGNEVGSVSQLKTDGTATASFDLRNMNLTSGQMVDIVLKADLRDPTNNYENLISNDLTATIGSFSVQGLSSGGVSTTSVTASKKVNVGTTQAFFGKAAGFTGSTIPQTMSEAKIGSFEVTAGQYSATQINNIKVSLAANGLNLNTVSSLTLKESNGTIITQYPGIANTMQDFYVGQTINQNESKTYDLFANFNNAALNGKLTVTATGTLRDLSNYGNSKDYFAGPATTTVGVTGIATTTLSVAASKGTVYVGGNVSQLATFNVETTNGNNVTASKIEVVVSNPDIVTGVTIDGVVANKIGTKGLYYVNSNKVFTLGSTVEVGVNFLQPTTNNQYENATTAVAVTYIGTSNSSQDFGTQGQDSDDWSTIVAQTNTGVSNAVTLVRSYPTKVTGAGKYVNSITNGTVQLGTVTITASTLGNLTISAIPVSVGIPGSGSTMTGKLELRINNNTYQASATGSSAVISVPNIAVSAGQSVTFEVWGNGVTANDNGTASVQVTPSSSFVFSDYLNSSLTGSKVENYGN